MEQLKNNSNEMKTVVETYLVEETVDLIFDNEQLDKWNKHVKALGLEGQEKIAKPDKSPIPYMHMKQTLVEVFNTLCPARVPLKDFNIQPIPVEILDLIAMSVNEKHFNEIQIWYDDKSPDPVAVGITSEYRIYDGYLSEEHKPLIKVNEHKSKQAAMDYINTVIDDFDFNSSFGWETNTQHYLIGKWGDVKQSIEELKTKALNRYVSEDSTRLQLEIKEAKRKLDDVELLGREKFGM